MDREIDIGQKDKKKELAKNYELGIYLAESQLHYFLRGSCLHFTSLQTHPLVGSGGRVGRGDTKQGAAGKAADRVSIPRGK